MEYVCSLAGKRLIAPHIHAVVEPGLAPLENGGVLLGWRAGEDRVVIDLRGPGPHALHGPTLFRA